MGTFLYSFGNYLHIDRRCQSGRRRLLPIALARRGNFWERKTELSENLNSSPQAAAKYGISYLTLYVSEYEVIDLYNFLFI